MEKTVSEAIVYRRSVRKFDPNKEIDVNSNMLEVILMLYSQQQIFIFICIGISYTFAETKDTLLCYDVTGSFKINN